MFLCTHVFHAVNASHTERVCICWYDFMTGPIFKIPCWYEFLTGPIFKIP